MVTGAVVGGAVVVVVVVVVEVVVDVVVEVVTVVVAVAVGVVGRFFALEVAGSVVTTGWVVTASLRGGTRGATAAIVVVGNDGEIEGDGDGTEGCDAITMANARPRVKNPVTIHDAKDRSWSTSPP